MNVSLLHNAISFVYFFVCEQQVVVKWRFSPISRQYKNGKKRNVYIQTKKFPSVYFIISPLFYDFLLLLFILPHRLSSLPSAFTHKNENIKSFSRCKNIAWKSNKKRNTIGWHERIQWMLRNLLLMSLIAYISYFFLFPWYSRS